MTFPSTVPMDHPLVLRATLVAVQAHDGQRRKHIDEPYAAHPIRVAHQVAQHTMDPHVIAAALLHDVVEDTEMTLEDIGLNFGYRIRDMVEALTDTPPMEGLNRARRKELDRQRIAKAGPDVQLIKAADMLDNYPSIKAHDPDFAKVFLREKELLMGVMQDLNPHLRLELQAALV